MALRGTTNRELSASLKSLSEVATQLKTTIKDLGEAVGAIEDPTEKVQRRWAQMSVDIKDTVFETNKAADQYKEIYKLVSQMGKLRKDELKDVKDFKKLVDESAEAVKKIGVNGAIFDKKKLEENAKLLKDLKDLSDKIGTSTSLTNDEYDDLIKKAQELGERAQSMEGKFARLTERNGPLSGMDHAFSGALRAAQRLDQFGFNGLIGRMQAINSKTNEFKVNAHKMGEEQKKAFASFTHSTRDKDGNRLSDTVGRRFKKGETRQALAGHYNALSDADKEDFVHHLTGGRGGFGGWFDRKIAAKALEGGGGGILGKMAGSLMEAGGGSAMGGIMGMASKFAGPAGSIMMLLELLSVGFEENAKMYSKLGKGGMVGGPGSLTEAYNGWAKALTSTDASLGTSASSARFWGLDKDKAMDMFSAVSEQTGQGLYGLHGKSDIDKAVAPGKRANNIFEGVVRNSAIYGKLAGLGETESAVTTMKFMHEFSVSMGELDDFFVSLGKNVAATGISTTHYLNLIEGITAQFDHFNKSMNYSVALVNLLGKGAKYTAEDIQGMVKGLTGEKKSLEVSAYAYRHINPKDLADMTQAVASRSQKAVEDKLGLAPGSAKDMTSMQLLDAVDKLEGAQKQDAGGKVQSYLLERTRANAFRSTDALGMAAADMNLGETPQLAIVKNMAMLKKAVGGNLMDLTTTEGSARASTSLYASELSKLLGVDFKSAMKFMPQAFHSMGAQMDLAAGGDAQAAARLGLSAADVKRLKKETAGGKSAHDTEFFKEWVNKPIAIANLSEILDNHAREDAEERAKANQKYITSPLDYIKRALAALVELIKSGLQILTNWFNYTVWGKTEEEQREKNREFVKGYANGGKTTKDDIARGEDIKKWSVGDSPEALKILNGMNGINQAMDNQKISDFLDDNGRLQVTDAQRKYQDAYENVKKLIASGKTPSDAVYTAIVANPALSRAIQKAQSAVGEAARKSAASHAAIPVDTSGTFNPNDQETGKPVEVPQASNQTPTPKAGVTAPPVTPSVADQVAAAEAEKQSLRPTLLVVEKTTNNALGMQRLVKNGQNANDSKEPVKPSSSLGD